MSTEKVIKFAQEILSDEPADAISPSLINEKIDLVLRVNPKWGETLDRERAIVELVRRFSMWMGHDTTLKNEAGHLAWLTAARKKDWRYWQRYREWLERKMSETAIRALDKSADSVLGLLEDPRRDGDWDRRGLVVGHVQSGKTGSYTGLICKAADAGYKIIIILAGLHNNLRSQTQIRLDEGFLGYETSPAGEDMRLAGVGEIDSDPAIRPNFATNRTDKGDFNTAIASKLGISPEHRPWLFVVKKNKTVLEKLHKWIRTRVADSQDSNTGRRIVTNLPLLIIDDEADHASVDTGEQIFDDSGKPDEEHQPKTINRLIRRIVHSFSKSAYVGYTATPFANIFIHERGETREEGPDLFPAAFIINLGAPSSYVGPVQVFGTRMPEGRDGGLPLIRKIPDFLDRNSTRGWMPASHKRDHAPRYEGVSELPPSLREAIHSFLLATAARYLRGQRNEHASMLIHVTRFIDVQRQVHSQVAEYLRTLRQRLVRKIDHEASEAALEHLWISDFLPTSATIRSGNPEEEVAQMPAWPGILGVLPEVCDDIEIRMINGTAKDALDYSERSATGLKVIAIGGDKLSRGLTLEGLSTSYFLRASRMYDTLMQMGRWFGYRPGYLDVCRLYTTAELEEWFGHIADAASELREEFELMAASGATPRDYGLKVQSHPVLLVTSRLKMRTARSLMLSFSGSLVETVSLYRDRKVLEGNLAATRTLLAPLSGGELNPERQRNGSAQRWDGRLWRNAGSAQVVEFLESYRTSPAALKVNSKLLAEFVRKMSALGELTMWSIALLGSRVGKPAELAPGLSIGMITRKAETTSQPEYYSIGRLLSPRDESIDLDNAAWNAALRLTREARQGEQPRATGEPNEPDAPNGPAIRKVCGFGAPGVSARPERGLLIIYAIDPDQGGDAALPAGTPPVVGFAISFPGSNSGAKVEYKVNNVAWELDFGGSE